MKTTVLRKAVVAHATEKAYLIKFFRSKKFPKAMWMPRQFVTIHKVEHTNDYAYHLLVEIDKWFYDTVVEPQGIDNRKKKKTK